MVEPKQEQSFSLPWWAYALIAVAVLGFIAAIVFAVQARHANKQEQLFVGSLSDQQYAELLQTLPPRAQAKLERTRAKALAK